MSGPIRIPIADRTLMLFTGDITHQDADAIVNAANSSLMGGGGVDGAIHRAGGSAIFEECRAYRASNPPLPRGQAMATSAGSMAARYVIHTVGPIWGGGSDGEPEALASCYRESLRLADELKLISIAFPSISTGIYGYPFDLAAPVAMRAVTDALRNAQYVREVRFVLFDERAFDAYKRAAETLTQHPALGT